MDWQERVDKDLVEHGTQPKGKKCWKGRKPWLFIFGGILTLTLACLIYFVYDSKADVRSLQKEMRVIEGELHGKTDVLQRKTEDQLDIADEKMTDLIKKYTKTKEFIDSINSTLERLRTEMESHLNRAIQQEQVSREKSIQEVKEHLEQLKISAVENITSLRLELLNEESERKEAIQKLTQIVMRLHVDEQSAAEKAIQDLKEQLAQMRSSTEENVRYLGTELHNHKEFAEGYLHYHPSEQSGSLAAGRPGPFHTGLWAGLVMIMLILC